MDLCGKALPPKAATLLGSNTLLLVFCVPCVLALHSLNAAHASAAQFTATLVKLAAIGLFCQAVFYYAELYNLRIAREAREQTWRIFGAIGIVMLVLAAAFALIPSLNPGRDAILGLPLASLLVLLVTRQIAVVSRPAKVALIGPEESCKSLAETIRAYPEWNLKVAATFRPDEIDHSIADHLVDRVIMCTDMHPDPTALERLIDLKLSGLRVESAAQFCEKATGRIDLAHIDPMWFVLSNGFDNNRHKLLAKRCFDLAGATVLLILTLPLMLLATLAIAVEGKGPLLYRQKRVGRHGRFFEILKFRTMVPVSSGAKPQWTADSDRRITPLGRFMRTFRIDELPQLFNVLMGEMSLVGPRPEQPYFCDLLAKEIPFYHQRHTVPPGLTGWAQVRFRYGASIEESKKKLEYDLFYVKNLSMWLDIAIAFETLKVVLIGKGAK